MKNDTGFWKRTHNLDRLTLTGLVRAFFSYPTIWTYLALAAISSVFVVQNATAATPVIFTAALVIVIYPLVEYLLHRFVLHGRFLYKSRWTAAAWKRIHFDHHQDPHDLRILFGALYTTLPTIVVITLPVGWVVDGPITAVAAFATGLIVISVYEFCHCIQHLNNTPRSKYLQHIKRQHLAHHFHSEKGNFGITSYFLDRLFGTYYAKPRDIPRSATVFNIGYTAEEASRYPWVEQLSNGIRRDGGPRPLRQSSDPSVTGA